MKVLGFLFAMLVLPMISFGQQVRLTPQTFDNGFKYPVAQFQNKTIQDSINVEIQKVIADLKASDFCIGEYGYVQKGSHIEIHMICNCIDMQQSEHRYLLLNLDSGSKVPHSDLFSEKMQKDALKFIVEKVSSYQANNSTCTDEFKALGEDIDYDSIDIRLYKDGIEVRPLNSENCQKSTLRITWSELKKYLRYNFI